MREGHIDNDGIVHGTFDLVGTPVGQIVKAFIDAGVTFGISVRGAGDIIANSVDPETFIFRGFDLVTFPAFPNSIPTFTEIAASSNMDDKKKYNKVCAAVTDNLDKITSETTLDMLQAQFASQSKTYADIEHRKNKIKLKKETTAHESITASKLDAMTKLYIEATSRVHELARENERLRIEASTMKSKYRRAADAMRRISASQIASRDDIIDSVEAKYSTAIAANKRLKRENIQLENSNLTYIMKMKDASKELKEKESVISSINLQLDETVSKLDKKDDRASNLDEQIKSLKKQLSAVKASQHEYQKAYVSLYANALGVDATTIPITASMNVNDARSAINGQSRVSTRYEEPVSSQEVTIDSDDDGQLIIV